jgi:hypothetical protein
MLQSTETAVKSWLWIAKFRSWTKCWEHYMTLQDCMLVMLGSQYSEMSPRDLVDNYHTTRDTFRETMSLRIYLLSRLPVREQLSDPSNILCSVLSEITVLESPFWEVLPNRLAVSWKLCSLTQLFLVHRWRWARQPYVPAALYPQQDTWYLFLLEAESTRGS